jgi:1,2-diacylglycerol 3-alpha-glucosyltransferase
VEAEPVRIVMMTNTYLPMVGGVSRSVSRFTDSLRTLGHQVLVVAPTFAGMPTREDQVVRIPAIQNFNGSDFSVRLPVTGVVQPALDAFAPDIIHTHHPFLIGDTALRTAAHFNVPVVFTHHTMYERYTHYVPGDSPLMKRFAIELATAYANLCDRVVAPSESIAAILTSRGVTTPISTIPSGIEFARLAAGNGSHGRAAAGIPAEAQLIGHVGRLAEEKNLSFLADAAARVLVKQPDAWFLVVGEGPAAALIHERCRQAGVLNRLRMAGVLQGSQLADAYAAMDVFGFASTSETQGLVLAEAMATGVPVVALDAPGNRDVVVDGENGRLLIGANANDFAAALAAVLNLPPPSRTRMVNAARTTAAEYDTTRCAERLLSVYAALIGNGHRGQHRDSSLWAIALRRLGEEWGLLAGRSAAAGNAVGDFMFGDPRTSTNGGVG